jgi:hypothetical protein
MLPIKFESVGVGAEPITLTGKKYVRFKCVTFTNDFGYIKKDEQMDWLLFYPDTFEIKTSNNPHIIQGMSVFPTGMGKKIATLPSEINDIITVEPKKIDRFLSPRVVICIDGPDEIGKSTLLSQTNQAIVHHTRYNTKLGKLAGDYAFGKYDGEVKKYNPCLPILGEEALFLSPEKMCVEIHRQLEFLDLLDHDTLLIMDRSLITTLRYFSPSHLDKVASYQYASNVLRDWLDYLKSLNVFVIFYTIGESYVKELEPFKTVDNHTCLNIPDTTPIELVRNETARVYGSVLEYASLILGRECSRKATVQQ